MPGGGGGDQCQGGGVLLQQKSSTGPSRVVPHRSTTPARSSLTSLFGWEAVSLDDMAALKFQKQNKLLISFYLHAHFSFQSGHPARRTGKARGRCCSPPPPPAQPPWLPLLPPPMQPPPPPPASPIPVPVTAPAPTPPAAPAAAAATAATAPSPAPPCRSRRLHRRQGCSKHGRSWS